MSIYRSYFKKNNTLIKYTTNNNSQNPVCELSYGTSNQQISRFIFEVDLTGLQNKIDNDILNKNNVVKHILHMTNTIRYADEYVGKQSYLANTERASSFDIELYNINQEWDEGGGYDFTYDPTFKGNKHGSNWLNAKTDVLWILDGSYESGKTEIIATQHFDKGSENIIIDITDYINQRLFGESGSTVYSGSTFGVGIKFTDEFENLATDNRQSVAFHTKYTNSWYEPYVETIIDDTIIDDRNHFYLDCENSLYLSLNVGYNDTIRVDKVEIFDYKNNLIDTIDDSVEMINKGIYMINYSVSSDEYPDSVLFKDKWYFTINGKQHTTINRFYLIPSMNKYLNSSNSTKLNNYYFTYSGINDSEKIHAGDIRKLMINNKQLYPNQNNNEPINLDYRIFIKLTNNTEIDIIPYTTVNRINNELFILLDTSWLIPNDYFIQLRMSSNSYFLIKETLKFTIVSDSINFIQ